MRPNVWYFLRSISEIFETYEPILEIGALQIPEQESISSLRVFFQGKRYIGCDIHSGIGVDMIADAHKLSFSDETIGTSISLETLEHVENPIRVMEEIYRVLNKNGLVIISSSMNISIHNYPSDFWRFTPEGFLLLLKNFSVKIIGSQGNLLNPHTVFGIGFKNKNSNIPIQFEEFCLFFSKKLRQSVHSFAESLILSLYIDNELSKTHKISKLVSPIISFRNKSFLGICRLYNQYVVPISFIRKISKFVYKVLRNRNLLPDYKK